MFLLELKDLPSFLKYIPWVLVVFTLIINLKGFSNLKPKKQRKKLQKTLISLVFVWSSSYFLFPFIFSLIQTANVFLFYPKYEAVVVDKVVKQHGKHTTTKRKVFLWHAVYEIAVDEKKERIESNEGTQEEKIILGRSTTISYKNGLIINHSFRTMMFYFFILLITILLLNGFIYSMVYALNKDVSFIKYCSVLAGLYFYLPYVLILLLILAFRFIYSIF